MSRAILFLVTPFVVINALRVHIGPTDTTDEYVLVNIPTDGKTGQASSADEDQNSGCMDIFGRCVGGPSESDDEGSPSVIKPGRRKISQRDDNNHVKISDILLKFPPTIDLIFFFYRNN